MQEKQSVQDSGPSAGSSFCDFEQYNKKVNNVQPKRLL
jgi:hypothetical protein